jgi:beta-lactam-binding protein with PASTA domain
MNATRVLFAYLFMLAALWANPIWAHNDSASKDSAPAANVANANVSSDSVKDVKVPGVVGLRRDEAILELLKAGLRIGDVRELTNTLAAYNHVIDESPAAGSEAKVGSKVDLVIARPPEVKVPGVVGLTLGAAKAVLDKSDLEIGRTDQWPSTTIAAGRIISQHPQAGATVREDRRVRLVVSTGTSQDTVPNVIGATQAAAANAITNAGLIVGTVTAQPSKTLPLGIVISETPAAGTDVLPGSAVNFVISAGSAPHITAQPRNISVLAGQPATFTVEANGTAPLSYQWTLAGATISGATSASYTTGATSLQQSGGQYAVLVGNSAGIVSSANAILTVNTPSTTTTTAISSTVALTSPTLTLDGVATIDFTGQAELEGQTVSIARIIDTNINSLAADQGIDLDANLTDAYSVQVAVPVPPTGNVTATISAKTALAIATANQVATIYVYSTVGDSGDGEDTFAALPGTIDVTADTITVDLPGTSFQPISADTYIATLKIGVSNASSSPPIMPSQASEPLMKRVTKSEALSTATSAELMLPCPVVGALCIERSRYNPDRYLGGIARPHFGIDFAAPVGTSIYVPAGAPPIMRLHKLNTKRAQGIVQPAPATGGPEFFLASITAVTNLS